MSGKADDALKELLSRRAYGELKARLGVLDLGELAARWGRFSVPDRLVIFKLLDAPRAEDFWRRISFEDRYFLLMALPTESLGPALDHAEAGKRRLFHELPRPVAEKMTREMIAEGRRRA